jgi:hypothetical protein
MTIFIGANNLCGACQNRQEDLPDNYIAELDSVLAVRCLSFFLSCSSTQQINNTIPRTFVNIVMLFNISQVLVFLL